MYTLVTFATHWGSKHGGINSFNADFLAAFGIAYHLGAQVICIVASDTPEEETEAAKAHVQLVALPYTPEAKAFGPEHGQAGFEQLRQRNISFDPDTTVWLGHDRITGAAAVAAAKLAGGRSAVIHHMSYDHYESYAEDSESAQRKTQEQTTLLQEADLVLAVGPLLRDAAGDRLSKSKPVHTLIPGLAEIDPREAPATFVAFLSGRLSNDAARIKQGHLGVAAFAIAQRNALENGMPEPLLKQPKLLLRGVDFEGQVTSPSAQVQQHPEAELKRFAEEYAQAVVNLHALPYTEDRQLLYSELSGASVALMPSWHEGFGLVAWEAIAAGVPLIISRNSGVYRLLEDKYPGAEIGYVYGLDIRGAGTFPFFHEEDLKATVSALNKIANNPGRARQQAAMLRIMLEGHTWVACAEQTAKAFEWSVEKGSVPAISLESLSQTLGPIVQAPTDRDQEPLRIPVGQWQTGAGMAESQLLRAEEALLPFDPARQSDVEDLKEWLDDTKWPISVRLITGAGGQGKTRLALEVCQQRVALGWSAGFLDSNLEANRMTATWQVLRNPDQALLIVIDYAETRQLPFLSLLKAALKNSANQPVRILLLARDGGEWWDNLPSKDTQCEALLSGYATTGPFRLEALYPAEHDRRQAYGKALNAFAQTLGVSAPDVLPDLLGEHFERPLYVQMAALLALYGERPTSAQGLTKALLNHERRYWLGVLAHLNWPEPERRAETLLALTTLAGGFATAKAAEMYWIKAKGRVLRSAEFNSMFRDLSTLYPATQGLQAMRPDLLGEALVAQALLRPGGDTILNAVLSNTATQLIRRNALTVLARLSTQRTDLQEVLVDALSRHFNHCCNEVIAVSRETAGRLPTLLEFAFARLSPGTKSQSAGLLAPLLHGESIQLAALSCLVSDYLVQKYREKFERNPGNTDRMAEYAGELVDHAVKLSYLGRYEQACDASRQGLDLFRRLSAKDSKRFEPIYTMSLGNYADQLREAGHGEEAFERGRETVKLFKRLVQTNADRFESEYARSLTNHANYLSDAGLTDDALDNNRQGVEIYNRLARTNPERHEADYAWSLNNYANHLGEAGKYDEALEHSREGLDIFKRLAQENPDRFEGRYATSLSGYANDLRNLGRYEDALERAREGLEIRKRLAQKNPERFEPSYAESLNNYAGHLQDVGLSEQGLEHARESLKIRRRLAQTNGRYELHHATSLGNYANHLKDAGKSEEALDYARESLEAFRRLTERNHNRFEPEYAWSLNNFAIHLQTVGRNHEAIENVLTALEIRKRLARKNLDRFELPYASSLITFASCLKDIGKYEQALELAREQLEILKRLAAKTPYRFADPLFSSVCFECFLACLCGQDNALDKLAQDDLLEFIPSHRRTLMLVFYGFALGCSTANLTLRRESFREVSSRWGDLSVADKIGNAEYWLCAAAWCATFEPAAVAETDWKASWRQFVKQRNGFIPRWMLDIARRLEFEWPE